MKKLATRLTPAIKAWIKEEFEGSEYQFEPQETLFHFPNKLNNNGFSYGYHTGALVEDYTEVSEQEFLAEFGKKPIIQYYSRTHKIWKDCSPQNHFRIKPTPDYSKEIEALQNKAKENNQKVSIIFE